ncbi:hypothetical protein K435DRAFT_787888 [Dendrothele bispora CBS 962.96]|uniref:Polynucleotide 5'-hydroxyl-kinase GRC3 n=1 Tax=Dendrothele bispora (strain CBS 962.96) TaxID=1314807 RepID=A0A4V4HIZ6_DENBC|nr:hypothetical protein K435DRAFT_787888 [Dendrothele bispora CBS 962.96]
MPSVLLSSAKPSSTSKTLKRKQSPNSDSIIPKMKKKKAQKKRGVPQGRYFQEVDVFQGQDGIIVIDSDDGEDISDDSLMDQSPVGGVNAEDMSVLPRSRAWSPSHPINDSSDEDRGPASQFTSNIHRPESPSILSTCHPVQDQNTFYLTPEEISALGLSCSSPGRLFSLQEGESLTFVGTYRLTVLAGCLSLCGLTLHASPQPHDVFAPRSSPLPVLKACSSSSSEDQAWKPPSFGRLRDIIQTSSTLFALQELRTNVEGLGSVCRTFERVFQPPRFNGGGQIDMQLTGVHMVTNAMKDIHPFIVPSSWDAALETLSSPKGVDVCSTLEPPLCFVRGSKKSGKSSFAKTLVNRLVQKYHKVAYLECDIGQSEFTPGGMVSLNIIEKPVFGPPFTHPTLPNQAHYIGAFTPRTSPSHYLAAIQALVQYYRLDVQIPVDSPSTESDSRIAHCIPLVVNTMGWAKGLGADLTSKIQDMVQPTHVFEFGARIYDSGWSTGFKQSAPDDVGYAPPRSHSLLEPITPSINYSAVDNRTIALLSYFHAVFPGLKPESGDFAKDLKEGLRQMTARTWNISLPLCATPPFEVDVRSVVDRVFLSGVGSEDVVLAEIERVLNGAVVGLLSCEPGTLDSGVADSGSSGMMADSGATTAIPYVQGADMPSPMTSITHGLALIRSVSPGGSSMHVLTPMPPALLPTTRVFVKGEMELPVWGMLDFHSTDKDGDDVTVAGISKGKVPYLQWGKGEGLGGEKRRVRRNLMRKAQM